MTTTNRLGGVFRHALIWLGAAAMLYPLLWMLSASFKPGKEIFKSMGIIPADFTLENYKIGWAGVSQITFQTFFANTILIVVVSIAGILLTCSMAAYAFGRLKFSFRSFWFAIMLTTMMLPAHVVVIPQYIIFNKLEWINTYLPLLVPKFLATDGFFIFLLVQFIRGLPRELDQAATVDGCGPFRMYWQIIMPLALPALVTSAIFAFIWTWNDFFSQMLYISNIKLYTVSLGLRLFLDSSGESSWGPLFAMSILSLIPVFVVFIMFQKLLIEGIAAGGVKG